jgi:RHS repeat-associated protein
MTARLAPAASVSAPLSAANARSDFNIGYCGYRFNGDIGAYTVRFRHYDPTPGMCRWLERDPAGYQDGPSLYSYLGRNPMAGTDPYGLDYVPNGGNSADNRPTWLYRVVDRLGNLIKHGVTSHDDVNTRYPRGGRDWKRLEQIAREMFGSDEIGIDQDPQRIPRREALNIERQRVETNPGPANKERWAGRQKPGHRNYRGPGARPGFATTGSLIGLAITVVFLAHEVGAIEAHAQSFESPEAQRCARAMGYGRLIGGGIGGAGYGAIGAVAGGGVVGATLLGSLGASVGADIGESIAYRAYCKRKPLANPIQPPGRNLRPTSTAPSLPPRAGGGEAGPCGG